MRLELQVIHVSATHCVTHPLRSTLVRIENAIEIARQSKIQCTNFRLHTMVYS